MNINNPIYIIIKGVFLLSPFLVAQVFELFILPIDYFTFRVWEAAFSPYDRFPGRFYPNLNIYKEKEFGDRYRIGGDYKQYKPVQWQTDSYGWRNSPEVSNKHAYDIVTLGDSNIVGSFMDQNDTLAEVISRKGQVNAYNYSIGYDHIQYYFSDKRMTEKSTKLVVIESKVGNWLWTGDYLKNFSQTEDDSLAIVDRKPDFMNNFNKQKQDSELKNIILSSRLKKQPLYNRIRSELLIDTAEPSTKLGNIKVGIGLDFQPYVIDKVVYDGQSQKVWPISLYGKNHVKGSGATVSFKVSLPTDAASTQVTFDARVTTAPSKNDVWIIREDGVRDILTQISLSPNWNTYQIELPHGVSGTVRIEIQNSNSWQYFGLRNAKAHFLRSNNSPEIILPFGSYIKNGERNDKCSQYPIFKPTNLRPIEPLTNLDPQESNFYFYQAVKAVKKQTDDRGQDLIFFLMPDPKSFVLAPSVRRLRCEGVKIISYEDNSIYKWGVDEEWYWNHADSHWREQAVNLTADEILRMWRNNEVANRPFNPQISSAYSQSRK